jgi:hypothetical protein
MRVRFQILYSVTTKIAFYPEGGGKKLLRNVCNPLQITRCHIPRDRLCGLVVRVLGYRSGGSGFDSRHYQIS